MNTGLRQFSQVGKFLTVYPANEREAVALARRLHQATRGLRGPEIPFDCRYRARSLVYYRYGAFAGGEETSSVGRIQDPAGRRYRDLRTPGSAVPRWLADPFRKSRPRFRPPRGPIGEYFLPFRVLTQRGKGGVYEALDLSVSPARLVIIKEGRPEGETDRQGRDGYWRVRHEARVLHFLRQRGIDAVPEVLAEFQQSGKRYLVLEKVAGRPLLPRKRTQPLRPSWPRAARLLDRLAPLLARIHAAGWVWRDGKPSHIFLGRGGSVRLLDFEGACRVRDTTALPWSSLKYELPGQDRRPLRRPGTLEDDYALGVIAFQFGSGSFPSAEERERAAVFRATGCGERLHERIEALLAAAW